MCVPRWAELSKPLNRFGSLPQLVTPVTLTHIGMGTLRIEVIAMTRFVEAAVAVTQIALLQRLVQLRCFDVVQAMGKVLSDLLV